MNQEARAMERLTAEDRLTLWPDERWPQEVGLLAQFDLTVVADRDTVPDLEVWAAAARTELRTLSRPVPAGSQPSPP